MARAALVLLMVIAAAVSLHRPARVSSAPPPAPRPPVLSIDGTVDPAGRALIDQSLAAARPEARRLIDAVASLVDVSVGVPQDGALGTTQRQADGRYLLVLDLARTLHSTGQRGVVRMVLHELGHVVDSELVPPQLAAQLDAGIPPQAGPPAPREERFAETFAKWAMGNDLGVNIYSGYAVPPPSRGFDAWAAPLASLPAR